jgi:hypothetical protein
MTMSDYTDTTDRCAEDAPLFELLWCRRRLTSGAETINGLIDALQEAADELREMRDAGVDLEPLGSDGHALLLTDDPEVAERFGFEEEEEDAFDDWQSEDEFFDNDPYFQELAAKDSVVRKQAMAEVRARGETHPVEFSISAASAHLSQQMAPVLGDPVEMPAWASIMVPGTSQPLVTTYFATRPATLEAIKRCGPIGEEAIRVLQAAPTRFPGCFWVQVNFDRIFAQELRDR